MRFGAKRIDASRKDTAKSFFKEACSSLKMEITNQIRSSQAAEEKAVIDFVPFLAGQITRVLQKAHACRWFCGDFAVGWI
jgi:hypothetical protein